MIVADILSLKGTTLFTVNPDMMLSDAVLTMDEHDIGSVAVMENGKLAGMLTFREVVRMLARRQLEHRSGPTRPVAEIRSSPVRDPPGDAEPGPRPDSRSIEGLRIRSAPRIARCFAHYRSDLLTIGAESRQH